MKKTYLLLLCLVWLTFFSCGNEKATASKKEAAPFQRTSTWTDQDMEFQVNYCLQIMATLNSMDKEAYCKCFLEKVKYFYEPKDIMHAYKQEHDFSQECMKEHYTNPN